MPKKTLSAKKKMIIALCVILGAVLILYLLTILIPMIFSRQADDQSEYVADYNFYPANHDEDIFADADYMKLISNGMLEYDNGSNSIITIKENNYSDQDNYAQVVIDMLYSIRDGDEDRYNLYFSDEYFKSNSKKESFTPQKIYNARLNLFSTEAVTEGKDTYTKKIFKLEYQIYENNGTFRKDIGDDSRPQYIYVTNRNGNILIDSITYPKSK